MLGQNNNGAYDDDISSYNSNAHNNNDEAVDNLLNEASEFNCHEIQAANLNSELQNKVGISSLIYK